MPGCGSGLKFQGIPSGVPRLRIEVEGSSSLSLRAQAFENRIACFSCSSRAVLQEMLGLGFRVRSLSRLTLQPKALTFHSRHVAWILQNGHASYVAAGSII